MALVPHLTRVICIFALAAVTSNLQGRSIIAASPEEAAARADSVLSVKILSSVALKAGEVFCGYAYEASVGARTKGVQGIGTRIEFGYLGGLESGQIYTLYLKADPVGAEFLAQLRSSLPGNKEVEEMALACQSRYGVGMTFFRADSQR